MKKLLMLVVLLCALMACQYVSMSVTCASIQTLKAIKIAIDKNYRTHMITGIKGEYLLAMTAGLNIPEALRALGLSRLYKYSPHSI